MQVVLEEARSSYPEEIVVELQSETIEDMESNVRRIVEWIHSWRSNHGLDNTS
jgi:adenylate kinase